ncbi:hypothetical protein [Lacipirellula parvula]|uniref:Secreted protein n=1 Tax=Lacipirellula parvula TaxID=2650471 RepID=A0A5K7X1B6_9BACT|nr:hypothetical protein [Lacipirellula parvula]BBO30438.1 hypothetical protein PLANPX_0050 [Lacipirellula parvula]
MRHHDSSRTWLATLFVALTATGAGSSLIAAAEPAIKLDRETTFITNPLAEDDLPNYAQAIIDRQAKGVTEDNNGAIIFWQAMGPSGVSDDDFQRICGALRIDPQTCQPRFDGPRTELFEQRLVEWLQSQDPTLNTASAAELSQQVINAVTDGRLLASSVPPATSWLKANEQRLDQLIASAARPRFYSPPPNLLQDQSSELALVTLPDAEQLRSAACALALRANWRLSKKQCAEAWQDAWAMWQQSNQANQGWTVINSLVCVSLRERAGRVTLAILQSPEVSTKLLHQIRNDLSTLEQSTDLAPIIDFGERCVAMDICLRLFRGRLGGLNVEDADSLTRLRTIDFDESQVLLIVNDWHDRVARAAREPQSRRRVRVQKQLFAELAESVPLVTESLNRDQRSRAVGDALAYYLLDAVASGFKAKSRDETRLRLLRVAVELAVYRAEHNGYPTSLDELALDDATLLGDPYSDERLIYRRTRDGYLLYSLFEDKDNDNGSDFTGEIRDGAWVESDEVERREHDDCDLAIRLPLPPFQLPVEATSDDTEP